MRLLDQHRSRKRKAGILDAASGSGWVNSQRELSDVTDPPRHSPVALSFERA